MKGIVLAMALWVPHRLLQKPSTATSFAVRTRLISEEYLKRDARLCSWFLLRRFPREYWSSICFPTASVVEPPLYFSVVCHHEATEGCAAPAGKLNELMKSTIMERWVGVKLPYHNMLTEKRPLRRTPLWYLSTSFCSASSSAPMLGFSSKRTPQNTINKLLESIFIGRLCLCCGQGIPVTREPYL